MNDTADNDPRLYAIPDIHGHAKGEHKAFIDERPIALSARMLFLWFFHACRRGWPRFLMVTDHMNYLTFEDPAAINLVRRALKLAQAGDLYGAAETASVEVGHAAVVSEGLRRGMRYSIGAEVDNDPRSRPDAQNIVDAMKPDGMIRSVHFLTIDHPTHGAGWNWPFDNPEFADVHETVGTAKTWEIYMATLLDAVERLPGNIVGHFYVPALFGHWPDDATLEAYEDQIVDACEARGMAIELNTRFLYRDHPEDEKAKYLAAHRRLLTKCKAKNVGIAVGSDAHSPKDQGRGFATVLALLDECEINELVFPIAGRLARVALRVERKVEPPAAPDPPAAAVEEKKSVRKPRTSEAPARSRDSSSKREESYPGDEAAPADETAPAKAKPRAKRGTTRAAAAAPEAEESPSVAPAEVKSGEADATAIDSAEIDDSVNPIAAAEPDANAAALSVEPAEMPVAESVVDESSELPLPAIEADDDDDDDDVNERPVSEAVVADSSSIESADDRIEDSSVEPIVNAPEFADPATTEASETDDDDAEEPDDELVVALHVDSSEPSHLAGPSSPEPHKARPKAAPAKAKASTARAKVSPAKAKPAKKVSKAAPKAAPKKSAVKKSAAKKTPAKSAPAKKAVTVGKKTAVKAPALKKASAKKAAAKKAGAKKPAPKRR